MLHMAMHEVEETTVSEIRHHPQTEGVREFWVRTLTVEMDGDIRKIDLYSYKGPEALEVVT